MPFAAGEVLTADALNRHFGTSLDLQQLTGGTTNSGAYTTVLGGGATVLGGSFVANAFGAALIEHTCEIICSGANFAACTIEIRAGAIIGAGTAFLLADDAQACINGLTTSLTVTRVYRARGLTPGATYNIRELMRTGGLITGTYARRVLALTPTP